MFLVQLKEGAAAGINARGRDLSRSRERAQPSSAVPVHKLCLQKGPFHLGSPQNRRGSRSGSEAVNPQKSYDTAREPPKRKPRYDF